MRINVAIFDRGNATDSCAVTNVLSSQKLFNAARSSGVHFSCTRFVEYECLHKRRKQASQNDEELKDRFRIAKKAGSLRVEEVDINDLQVVSILEQRKRLGKGELSTIVFAMKTRQAFLTDDQRARKLALTVMPADSVQTTPHLLGWLFYNGTLRDADKDIIVAEHKAVARPLAVYFEKMYLEALRCRLMVSSFPQAN